MSNTNHYWAGKVIKCVPQDTTDSQGNPTKVYTCPWCVYRYLVNPVMSTESHLCDHWFNRKVYYLNEHCIAGVGDWVLAEVPNI